MLCNSHATSGCPPYHTEGCEACADARAKGIVRPNIEDVPKKQRGRRKYLYRQIDWSKIKPENRHGLACAIQTGKMRG